MWLGQRVGAVVVGLGREWKAVFVVLGRRWGLVLVGSALEVEHAQASVACAAALVVAVRRRPLAVLRQLQATTSGLLPARPAQT